VHSPPSQNTFPKHNRRPSTQNTHTGFTRFTKKGPQSRSATVSPRTLEHTHRHTSSLCCALPLPPDDRGVGAVALELCVCPKIRHVNVRQARDEELQLIVIEDGDEVPVGVSVWPALPLGVLATCHLCLLCSLGVFATCHKSGGLPLRVLFAQVCEWPELLQGGLHKSVGISFSLKRTLLDLLTLPPLPPHSLSYHTCNLIM